MFCGKCGRPIPEGQQDCAFCNPPAVQPEQIPQYEPAPVQQPVDPEPAFELNMPAEGSSRKKSGGKKPLIITALVLVAALVLAIFNFGNIVRFFKRSFFEPAAYLQDVEKAHVADFAKNLAESYDKSLEVYSPKGSSVDSTVTVKANDQVMSLLSTALSQNGVSLDLNWVKSISISPKVEMYENTMGVELGVGLNGTHLATVSVIMDYENEIMFLGIPELHDTHIQMDLPEELQEMDYAAILKSAQDYNGQMMEIFPSGEQIETLINRYFAIVAEGLEDVEKSTETVEVDGVEQKLLVLTAKLSQEDILKIASKLLKEAKKDDVIEDVLQAYGAYMNSLPEYANGQMPDLYEGFSQTVEEGIDALDELIDEAESGRFLTIETYLDNKDNVAGRSFTVSMEGEKVKAHYITVTEGSKFAFEAEMDTVEITGEGTIKGGKRTGSYTLSVDDTDYGTLELEDYACADDGTVSGTIRLIPADALYQMMELDNSVLSILGDAALALTMDGDTVTLGIEVGGAEMLSLSLSGETAKPSPIALPESFDVDDDDAGMKWLSELDLEAVVSKLEKAGVPEQYMDMIDQLVTSFRNEFN